MLQDVAIVTIIYVTLCVILHAAAMIEEAHKKLFWFYMYICVCLCTLCVCSDLLKLHLELYDKLYMPHIPVSLCGLYHDLYEVQSSPQLKAHMWAVL